MSSSTSFDSSFEAFRDQAKAKKGLRLTERICNVSHFLFRLRVQLRFGKLSRAPLELLSLRILPDTVECDCLARPNDPWDADVSDRMARKHATLQVLRDAIDVRSLLYKAMPDVQAARLRIFRRTPSGEHNLVMSGYTHRNDQSARGVHSLTMRAKVLGFQFRIEDDQLRKLSAEQADGVG